MKSKFIVVLSVVLSVLSSPVFAHDPKEHDKENAAAPECAKMKEMKMDASDPVMQAMQKKCKEQMNHEATEHQHEGTKNTTDVAKTATQTSEGASKKQSGAAPDCAKMDMNDPAMKAMHDKCAQQMKHEHTKGTPSADKQ